MTLSHTGHGASASLDRRTSSSAVLEAAVRIATQSQQEARKKSEGPK